MVNVLPSQTVWHGSSVESLRLLHAVSRHCQCAFGPNGARIRNCAAHRMLVEDQRALDGLLFAHHIAAQLLHEEFHVLPPLRNAAPAAAPRLA